jgi:hypothetical protein
MSHRTGVAVVINCGIPAFILRYSIDGIVGRLLCANFVREVNRPLTDPHHEVQSLAESGAPSSALTRWQNAIFFPPTEKIL